MMLRRQILKLLGIAPMIAMPAVASAQPAARSSLLHDGMTTEQWMAVRDLEWHLAEITAMTPEQADALFKSGPHSHSPYEHSTHMIRARSHIRDMVKVIRGQYATRTVFR